MLNNEDRYALLFLTGEDKIKYRASYGKFYMVQVLSCLIGAVVGAGIFVSIAYFAINQNGEGTFILGLLGAFFGIVLGIIIPNFIPYKFSKFKKWTKNNDCLDMRKLDEIFETNAYTTGAHYYAQKFGYLKNEYEINKDNVDKYLQQHERIIRSNIVPEKPEENVIEDVEITSSEKHLMNKLFVMTKISNPFLILAIILPMLLLLPTMIIDIWGNCETSFTVLIVFTLVPPALSLITWMITSIGSKILVQSEKWANILKKADTKKGVMDGAEEVFTTIKSIVEGGALTGQMKVINEHVREVAELTNVKLPNITSKKAWLTILLVPSIIVVVLFCILYGSKPNNYENNATEAETIVDAKTLESILKKKSNGYEVYFHKIDAFSDINLSLEKRDETHRSEVTLLYDRKGKELKLIHYKVTYDNTDTQKKPGKEEGLNIAINDISEMSNLLKEAGIESELTNLYLPPEAFKQKVLSTDTWEENIENHEASADPISNGDSADNSNNVRAYYTLRNYKNDESKIDTSYIELYVYPPMRY